MSASDQGIVRGGRGEEQPADKDRAQNAQKTEPGKSISNEATRDPKLNDAEKTPGSGMTPENGEAPSG